MSEEKRGKGTIEEAFSAIEEGNALAKQSYFWEALESFFEAHEILKQLAEDDSDKSGDEKVRALLKQEAHDYFFKSRKTLVQAMQCEAERDREAPKDDVDGEPKYCAHGLNDDEARQRMFLFASLFTREEDVWRLTSDHDEEAPAAASLGEQQSSLEERLSALNQSLPSSLKTTDERIKDINRGLNRMGISVYSQSDEPKRSLLDMPRKSEAEQVDDIIGQAKDEVALSYNHPTSDAADAALPKLPTAGGGLSKEEVSVDDALDSDESEKYSDDDDDNDEQLSKADLEVIREKVNAAQASLAQLNALLAASDEDDDVKFDQNSGKKALRDARVLLQQATRRWKEKTEE